MPPENPTGCSGMRAVCSDISRENVPKSASAILRQSSRRRGRLLPLRTAPSSACSPRPRTLQRGEHRLAAAYIPVQPTAPRARRLQVRGDFSGDTHLARRQFEGQDFLVESIDIVSYGVEERAFEFKATQFFAVEQLELQEEQFFKLQAPLRELQCTG